VRLHSSKRNIHQSLGEDSCFDPLEQTDAYFTYCPDSWQQILL